MRRGIAGVIAGWIAYLAIIINNVVIPIQIPAEYDWVKQAITTVPLIAGHSYLVHRYHHHVSS